MINPDRYDNPVYRGTDFWEDLLSDRALQELDDLEKLVIGCEIIAALDDPRILDL